MAKTHENPREQKQRLRGVVEKLFSVGQENPCKRRQKMPKQDEVIDDPRSEVRGRGLHLDDDVPIVTPTVQQTERPADAAEAHMSMGKNGTDLKCSCEDDERSSEM